MGGKSSDIVPVKEVDRPQHVNMNTGERSNQYLISRLCGAHADESKSRLHSGIPR